MTLYYITSILLQEVCKHLIYGSDTKSTKVYNIIDCIVENDDSRYIHLCLHSNCTYSANLAETVSYTLMCVPSKCLVSSTFCVGGIMMTVLWYYRPEDVEGSNRAQFQKVYST